MKHRNRTLERYNFFCKKTEGQKTLCQFWVANREPHNGCVHTKFEQQVSTETTLHRTKRRPARSISNSNSI